MPTKTKVVAALVLCTNAGAREKAEEAIKSQFPGAKVVACESLEAAVDCLAESRQPFSVVCLSTREFLFRAGDGRSYLTTLRDALRKRSWSAEIKFYFFSAYKRELLEVEGY